MSHYVEFPNLGWKFNVDSDIHLFGDFSIKWYGLLIAVGVLMATGLLGRFLNMLN